MPAYPWLLTNVMDTTSVPRKIRVLQMLGTPYPDGYDQVAVRDLREQAEGIAAGLRDAGFDTAWDREVVALIAYMQRLGTDINATPAVSGAQEQAPDPNVDVDVDVDSDTSTDTSADANTDTNTDTEMNTAAGGSQ